MKGFLRRRPANFELFSTNFVFFSTQLTSQRQLITQLFMFVTRRVEVWVDLGGWMVAGHVPKPIQVESSASPVSIKNVGLRSTYVEQSNTLTMHHDAHLTKYCTRWPLKDALHWRVNVVYATCVFAGQRLWFSVWTSNVHVLCTECQLSRSRGRQCWQKRLNGTNTDWQWPGWPLTNCWKHKLDVCGGFDNDGHKPWRLTSPSINQSINQSINIY